VSVLGFAVGSTHFLVVAAGAAAFVAALDMIEPFAAELDHPTAILTYGVSIRAVLVRNLCAPVAATTAVALAAAGAASWFAPGHTALVFSVATCSALAALAGATLNVALGPPPASQLVNAMMLPEIYGMVLVTRQAVPPACAMAGFAPLAIAPAAGDGAAIALALGVGAVSVAVIAYSGLRGV
jgi:hypothetical protein